MGLEVPRSGATIGELGYAISDEDAPADGSRNSCFDSYFLAIPDNPAVFRVIPGYG